MINRRDNAPLAQSAQTGCPKLLCSFSDNLIFKCDRIVAVSSVCTNWAVNFEINKINILCFVIYNSIL